MKHIKSSSPKIILAAIAFIIAIFTYVIIRLFEPNVLEKYNIGIPVFSFLISIISTLIFFLFFDALIFRKIKSLLETVSDFRSQNDKPAADVIYTGNDLQNLNNEIMAWAADRKEEIERLKKLEVYRREFLGNVSHELKTPVFNIQGYILTLLEGGLEDPTINRNYLIRAEKSVDRMITIIDDLEAISQLETGELQIEFDSFDIVSLIRDVIDSLEMKATAKGIILSFSDEIKSILVIGDRFRIRQVLVNLVVNSIKYGKEYGETKIRVYDMGNTISIEVADNGIGIAKEHLPRLFERFYRVDKSRSRDQGGTGLGLAIVKHIIEAHSQTINVMSTEGVGTVFSFTLKKA